MLDFIDELVLLSGCPSGNLAHQRKSETGYIREDLATSPADPAMRSLHTMMGP